MLYSGRGPEKVSVTQVIELYGPKGNRIRTISDERSLTKDDYDRRELSFAGSEPGTYTVKAHVTGVGGTAWDDN